MNNGKNYRDEDGPLGGTYVLEKFSFHGRPKEPVVTQTCRAEDRLSLGNSILYLPSLIFFRKHSHALILKFVALFGKIHRKLAYLHLTYSRTELSTTLRNRSKGSSERSLGLPPQPLSPGFRIQRIQKVLCTGRHGCHQVYFKPTT